MKIIIIFNNYMPETGGYQSASQMCSILNGLFGKDNVSKIFLTMPKKNFRRVRSFLRLMKEEKAYNAEGLIELNSNRSIFNSFHKLIGIFNYFKILSVKKLLAQADFIVITGFLDTSIITLIRNQAKHSKLFFNHAGDSTSYNSLITSDDKSLGWDGYLKYMAEFSKVLFQSELQLNFANEIGLASKKCFSLIPSCDEQSISDQIQESTNPYEVGYINIVTVGTLQERKNQELVIELASLMIDLPYRFYLIGDDGVSLTYTQKLKKMIGERNLTNVFILGHRTDYIVFVNYCDIVLNVSKFEGVSRVLRESLFLGKILVCTRILGNMECVVDGANGFLCEFKVRELIEKIRIIRNLRAYKKLEFELRSKLIYKNKYSLNLYRDNLRILFSE
jgi:glycosyltransferase involved in cell wall biosynthesis